MAFGIGHALVDDLHARDVKLRVGGGRACLHAREAACLGEVRGERPGLRGFVLFERRRLEREQQAVRFGRRVHEV